MSEAVQFIEFIHGDTSTTIIRATGTKYDGKHFTIAVDDIERRKSRYEIFFIPCRGGITVGEINEFPCVYTEVDVGRDEDSHYFPEKIVRERKQKILARLRSSVLPTPSAVIEGRNGYHLYWRLSDRPDRTVWTFIQQRIRSLMRGDPATESPHQPMRLPGTWWMKTFGGNHRRYKVSLIEQNDNRYTSAYFVDLLCDVEVVPVEPPSRQTTWHGSADITIDRTYPMIVAIAVGDIGFLQRQLKPSPRQFQSSGELHQFLTHDLSLEAFLGIEGKKCRCPFHHDRNPSAGIKQLKSGEEWFRCFSCGVTGNIIGIVQAIRRCSTGEALAFLTQVFRIEQTDSAWQRNQRQRLDEIARIISGNLMRYPALYRNVERDIPVLHALIDVAGQHLYSERYTSRVSTNPLFFVSMQYLRDHYTIGSLVRINRAIVNLALHGLIHRCGDEEIPDALLEKSHLHRRAKLEFSRRAERISYYTLCDCSPDDLDAAEKTAQHVQAVGLRRAALSYEGIHRTFGEEVANRVYVVRNGRPLSSGSDARNDLVADLLIDQIEERGWTSQNNIVRAMQPQWNAVVAERQVKRSLPSIISDNLRSDGETVFIRVRLNKQLKEVMGIDTQGFGEIIMLRDDYERVSEEMSVRRRKRGRPRKETSRPSVERCGDDRTVFDPTAPIISSTEVRLSPVAVYDSRNHGQCSQSRSLHKRVVDIPSAVP